MKNAKLNFGQSLKSLNLIIIFMLISSIGWTQNNNIKSIKGIKGKSAIEYERSLLPNSSVLIGMRSYSDKVENNNFKNKGRRLTLSYRQYLNAGKKPMSGLYVAPVISIGRHNVTYFKESDSGLGLTFLSLGIGAVAGDLSNTYIPEPEEAISGESKLSARSLGAKLGYQKRWKYISIDMGMNLSHNYSDSSKGMKVSDGTFREYNRNLQGTDVDLYIGFGLSF